MIAPRILALSLLLVAAVAHADVPATPPPPPTPLEFPGAQTAPVPAPLDRLASASPEVQSVVQWVGSSRDNAGLPFLVVDKVNAQVYAFTPSAQLKATAPILLGMGRGDKMLVPNDAPMSAIPPAKRITPAGRYRSWVMKDSQGKPVLSIDYEAAISLHIIAPGTPAEKRAARLASQTATDNRVSFGCINVPPRFFTEIVGPDFTPAKGIVYILPETQPAAQLFGFQTPAPTLTLPQATTTASGLQVSPMSAQDVPVSGGGALAAPSEGSK